MDASVPQHAIIGGIVSCEGRVVLPLAMLGRDVKGSLGGFKINPPDLG